MKTLIKIIFIVVLISTTNDCQNIWSEGELDYESLHLMHNRSVDSIKQIIITDDIEKPAILYISAVKYLYYLKSETQFLISNLNTEIDTTFALADERAYWYKAYTNIFFRGLLGDVTAIEKMKIIANYASYFPRFLAIKTLTEIGDYNNYNFVIDGYNDAPELFINVLAWYGKDPRYKDEVRSILFNKIALANSTLEVIMLTIDLNIFSNDGSLLLNNYFENKTGQERYDYFSELGIINKDNQPERSIYALQNETNDTFRVKYLPNPYEVLTYGSLSNRYLEPKFINSLRTLIISDTNSTLYQMRNHYILSYTPAYPDSSSLTNDLLDNLLDYIDSVSTYNWLGDLAFSNELKNILTTAKTNLQNGDSLACRTQVKAFQDLVDNVYKDSLNTDPRFVTIEGWKFLYWNAQYILDRLPEPATNPNLVVNLKNSLGNQIPTSNVKYYEGSWKDAVNNGDGTFTVITTRATVSIRVFYEYASQQIDNVPAQNNTYTFTTVNAAVQLKNSLGNFIDVGIVQYYAGAWRSFGTTSNGVAYKELLPINYSFRMTYEYGSIDKQQDISSNPTVVFQTVNAAVQLKNSLGNLIPAPMGDAGTVQYYAGAWRTFGTTSNGVAYKELLPVNYSFRMTYEFVSKDKQQNLSANPVVDFSTLLCSVKVSKTSNNQPINNADVKYYSGAWRNLGTTNADGISTKEILPANLSFRATSGNVSLDKQQDISVNSLVEIILNIP